MCLTPRFFILITNKRLSDVLTCKYFRYTNLWLIVRTIKIKRIIICCPCHFKCMRRALRGERGEFRETQRKCYEKVNYTKTRIMRLCCKTRSDHKSSDYSGINCPRRNDAKKSEYSKMPGFYVFHCRKRKWKRKR